MYAENFLEEASILKDFLKKQKLRFHESVRNERTNTLFARKRELFLENARNYVDIERVFAGFSRENTPENLLKYFKVLNDYVYDCSESELCQLFRRFLQLARKTLSFLAENREDCALLREFSMFLVNFSAFCEETQLLCDFFEETAPQLFEFFKETVFEDLKDNFLIFFGNSAIKTAKIAKKLVRDGILSQLQEVFCESLEDFSEKFLRTVLWFLEICVETAENPQFLVILAIF